MSAFLGPIHYWLYNKVQLQEAWINDILDSAKAKDWQAVSREKLNSLCGELEKGSLEEIIDVGNIHGWLQERIGVSESRLAFLVTELLKEDESRLSQIKEISKDFGKKHTIEKGTKAPDALKVFDNTLLDGMPCDHVNRILESNEDSVIWQKTQCVHSKFWLAIGGSPEVYDIIRGEVISGMLAESNLEFIALGNDQYEIKGRE